MNEQQMFKDFNIIFENLIKCRKHKIEQNRVKKYIIQSINLLFVTVECNKNNKLEWFL